MKKVNLNKIDFTLFNVASNAYKTANLEFALQKLNEFKRYSKLTDLTVMPTKQAYFEVLLNYQVGIKNDNMDALRSSTVFAKRLFEKHKLDTEFKISVATMLGDSYVRLGAFVEAEKYLELVKKLAGDKVEKEVLYKLFETKVSQLKLKQALELVTLFSDKSDLLVPAKLALLETAIRTENRALAMEQVNFLETNLEELNLSQQELLAGKLASELSDAERSLKILQQIREKQGDKNLFVPIEAEANRLLGNYNACISLMESFEGSEQQNRYKHNLLGRAHQALANDEDAWFHFSKSAELQLKHASEHNEETFELRNFDKEYQAVDLQQISNKAQATKNITVDYQPIFLVGFPRSGTTLLDTALQTQANIFVCSERPLIKLVIEKIEKDLNKQYPTELKKLSKKDLNELRRYYFQLVDIYMDAADIDTAQVTHVVDKMPLNMEHLPLIHLMFPAAPIVTSLREPMDVVLSCFQQNFKNMLQLNTVENIANKYHQVFEWYLQCTEMLNLNLMTVHYEQLVNDFDNIISQVSEHLHLPFDTQAMSNYDELAKSKVVTTASKDQVTKGLYKSSIKKWRKFEKQLAPYHQQLSAVASRLGY